MSDLTNQLMVALDTSAAAAEVVTGMKQQLMDKGWSEMSAERIVIHWITQG